MPKKRTMAPMEIQSQSSEWRDSPTPMATLSAKESIPRAPRSALAQSNAETTRRSARNSGDRSSLLSRASPGAQPSMVYGDIRARAP
jgi:hypothetical protein